MTSFLQLWEQGEPAGWGDDTRQLREWVLQRPRMMWTDKGDDQNLYLRAYHGGWAVRQDPWSKPWRTLSKFKTLDAAMVAYLMLT